MSIKIDLPTISCQQKAIYEDQVNKACEALKKNLTAIDLRSENSPQLLDLPHLQTKDEGWQPPEPLTVDLWFRQFQEAFPVYGTDDSLAKLLNITRTHSIREWRNGTKTVPYGVWRHFLVITGRAVQEIIPVMGFL